MVLEDLELRVLLASALSYSGTSGADSYLLRAKSGSPSQIEVLLNNSVIDTQTLTDVSSITFSTAGGADSLVVDYSNGSPIPAGGVVYNGGGGTDQLGIVGEAGGEDVTIFNPSAESVPAGIGITSGNTVEQISVTGGAGNDSVTIGQQVTAGVTMTGGAGNDTLTVNSTTASISFSGGTSATDHDVLNLNAGSFSFASDVVSTTAHLSLNVDGSDVELDSAQHLESLNIGPTGMVTAAAGGVADLYLDGLNIQAGGTLDLNDNNLVVNYSGSSVFTTIQQYVLGGYSDHLDSTVTGIISAVGQNQGGNSILALFDNALDGATDWPTGSGNSINNDAVVGTFTFFGDTNLDGQITGDDYGAIDAGLGSSPPVGAGLLAGDTNMDGRITGDDYGAIDANLGLRESTPPVVSVVNPTGGATFAGSMTLSASASDGHGVSSVQFMVDGQPLGTAETSAPFSAPLDTTLLANGTHQLTAVAQDPAGNSASSAPVNIVVNNSGPEAVGQWSSVISFPLVTVNAVMLNTGKILFWDGGPDCLGGISGTIYDPVTNTFTPDPEVTQQEVRDLFCSGQTVLADGRVLIAGGHECTDPNYAGTANSEIFDPATQTWSQGPDMTYRRWYPTVITLPDGRALTIAGSTHTVNDYDPIPEVYDPATNTWTTLSNANQVIPNYPFVFSLPDGRVFVAGSDEAQMASYVLDVNTQTWTVQDPTVLDAGTAVMYAPGKIMKAGSSYLSVPADNGGNVPSKNNTYVIDMNQPDATWQETAPMAYARTHLNMTVLPDGTVLTTGGSSVIGGIVASTGVLPAELWNPVTQTWSTMASMSRSREYHSIALLLPDGRVLTSGSGRNYANNYEEFSGEIYSPPYLFRGARPTITSSPDTVPYGSSFFVGTPDASDIQSVSLICNGSVTHSFNMDQRRVPLDFKVTSGGLTVQAPANADLRRRAITCCSSSTPRACRRLRRWFTCRARRGMCRCRRRRPI